MTRTPKFTTQKIQAVGLTSSDQDQAEAHRHFRRSAWQAALLLPPRQGRAYPTPWIARIEGVHGHLQAILSKKIRSANAPPPKPEGCFDQLVHEYFASPDYKRLAPATQQSYRNVIMRFLREEDVGHRLVREMTRQHVQAIVARRADRPGAANDLLKKLRILVHFAIDAGWRKDDQRFASRSTPAVSFTRGRIQRLRRSKRVGLWAAESGPPLVCSCSPAKGLPTSQRCAGPR